MSAFTSVVISVRAKRLSTREGKIAEIKHEIEELKKARKRVKKFNFWQKLDRKILGYYPYEKSALIPNYKPKKNELVVSLSQLQKTLKKLQQGKPITLKERMDYF